MWHEEKNRDEFDYNYSQNCTNEYVYKCVSISDYVRGQDKPMAKICLLVIKFSKIIACINYTDFE